MNQRKTSETLKSYIKSYMKFYFLIFFLIALTGAVVYVYNTSEEYMNQGMMYSVGLSGFSLAVFFVFDFSRYKKKINELERYKNNIDDLANEYAPTGVLHIDLFFEMIFQLNNKNKDIMQKSSKDMQDILDYYTMWVHQIKTPIAATGLMIANSDQDLSSIATQLFNIEHYVDMVLAYLRLDSQNNDLYIENYKLHDIIEKATKKYAPLFIQYKIILKYKKTDKYIITDEKWFRYVLEQILSNAIKYTQKSQKSSKEIEIYLENQDILVVQDNGIGIMENDLPLIYEKGYTGFNGRVDEKASGLGLYLAKKTLTMLSHSINITSQIDVGTKVYIEFKKQDLLFE